MWEVLPIELRDSGDGVVVYVGDQSGYAVKLFVRRLVVAPESL
jgi:hypothetical protein